MLTYEGALLGPLEELAPASERDVEANDRTPLDQLD